jgi:peptide/nickel transport system substrate-binding protein
MNRFYLIIILLLFLSCKKRNNENNYQIFRYNESAGITSLDPAFAKDQANIWACNQIFNSLVQLDNDLNIKPCIAKKWLISNNGTLYTFILRDDVYFHKSALFKDSTRKVVANDFEYSFKRIVSEKTASPGLWIFNYVKKDNNNYCFKAINDTIFQIELEKPFPPFLGLLTMQYCSVVPHEAVEYYGSDFRKNPIGTGPFYLKLWKEGVKMVLLKNKQYFEFENGHRLPFLDAVSVSFIIDKQSVFLEFIKGNIDFISGLDASYKDELLTINGRLNPKYENKITLYSQPYLNTEYFGILMDTNNQLVKNSPLKIKKIRQAINYGIDREKIIKYLRNNIGIPAFAGMVPKGMPGFAPDIVKGFSYNPEKAYQLVKECGYSTSKPLKVKLSTTASYLDICKFIQKQLSDIGIELELDVTPPATLRETVAQSKVAFFRGSWIADYPDAENYLSLFYSKNKSPYGPNYTHYNNKEFDMLYEKSRTETKDSLRYIIYRKMENIVMEDAPVVVLYYDKVLRFVRKNIEGLEPNPMNLLILKRVKKLSTNK